MIADFAIAKQPRPLPNLPGALNNFAYNTVQEWHNSNVLFRGDVQVTDKTSMFGRVALTQYHTDADATLPPPVGDSVSRYTSSRGIVYGYTHTFGYSGIFTQNPQSPSGTGANSLMAHADDDFPLMFHFSGIWNLPFGRNHRLASQGVGAALAVRQVAEVPSPQHFRSVAVHQA